MFRNPDVNLSKLERDWLNWPSREVWASLVNARARAGRPIMTPEVLAQATEGTVIEFRLTSDGFEAEVVNIQRPALEYSYRVSQDDYESFPRVPYEAKIVLRWDQIADEEPSLYIEIPDQTTLMRMQGAYGMEEVENTTPGGDYLYVGGSTQSQDEICEAIRTTNLNAWVAT